MKATLFAALLIALLMAGGAGYLLSSSAEPAGADRAAAGGVHPTDAPHIQGAQGPSRAEIEALRGDVARLERLVIGLKSELALLAEERARVPVGAAETVAAVESALAADGQFSAAQRAAVAEVFEAERQRLEAERQEAQRKREEQRILERAARVAQELGLAPADERRLADLLIETSFTRDELFAQVREGEWEPQSRELVREGMRELAEKYKASLTATFGEALGQAILEQTDMGGERRFRGPPGEVQLLRLGGGQ